MTDKKTRFQTYLYAGTESDVIDFFKYLRKHDKRMVFISAMRMYMNVTGHYLKRHPIDSIMHSAIPIPRDSGHPDYELRVASRQGGDPSIRVSSRSEVRLHSHPDI